MNGQQQQLQKAKDEKEQLTRTVNQQQQIISKQNQSIAYLQSMMQQAQSEKSAMQEQSDRPKEELDELTKLRNESKQLKQRLKQETEQRKKWHEMCKKKDEEAGAAREKLAQMTKEFEGEKAAHMKTQTLLQQKIEKIRNIEQLKNKLTDKWNSSPKVAEKHAKHLNHQTGSFSIPGEGQFPGQRPEGQAGRSEQAGNADEDGTDSRPTSPSRMSRID